MTKEVYEETTFLPNVHEKADGISGLRYIIVFLATAVCGICLACCYTFNYAVVCKVNSTIDTEELYNSNKHFSPVMHFTRLQTDLNFAAYSMGIFMGLLVIVLWKKYQTVSLRWMMFITCVVSAALTVAIPIGYDHWSPDTTLPLKLIQGFSIAPTLPLIGHITAKWAPRAELGMMVSVMTSYSQLGLFYLMATSGVLCDYLAWRSIFYYHGACCFLVGILWFIFYRDEPAEHPWLSTKELKYIQEGKSLVESKKTSAPMKKIFTNSSVWACLIACIGNYNGVSPFIVFNTSLMKKGLNLSDMAASHFNSASFLMQLALKLLSGKLSDVWSANETTKLRFFNTISIGLCGVLVIITGFLPSSQKILCAVMLAVFQGVIGFNAAGFNKAAVVVGRQHSHVILTCYGLILSVSTMFEPFLVGYIAPHNSWNEWFPLFLIHGSILIVANIVFCIFIEGKAASFTNTLAELPEKAEKSVD